MKILQIQRVIKNLIKRFAAVMCFAYLKFKDKYRCINN